MKKAFFLLTSLFVIVIFTGCVTTSVPMDQISTESEEPSESDSPVRKEIEISKNLTEGPLVLGSTEYLKGPVMEFSLLYSLYFPLSGIVPPYSGYESGKGTIWQVQQKEADEIITYERALLQEDDYGNSWWLFKVEGNGYKRTFEFLATKDWTLLELRYSVGDVVESYIPSVDEDSNLNLFPLSENRSGTRTVIIGTAMGDMQAEYSLEDNLEIWTSRKVTGEFLRTIRKENDEIIFTADLIGEEKGYKTLLKSY